MFTGLVEELGVINTIHSQGKNLRITVQAKKVMEDLKIDDSVSINGVCQTVVSRTVSSFVVVAVEETLRKTTFNSLATGNFVNLERAMRVGDRLGGHIVQGHVDCVGYVTDVELKEGSRELWIEFPLAYSQYIVPVGSICINGVSLTVANVDSNKFMVAIIPHTLEVTTLTQLKNGSKVNLEFDILGKYIEKMFLKHTIKNEKDSILQSWISQPDI
ncbi:MAG: riboflavin synthase [Ignavibacteriae bacterium]|nr:riboflavin synthase [Ignavibacteriota bacterium]